MTPIQKAFLDQIETLPTVTLNTVRASEPDRVLHAAIDKEVQRRAKG
jgi:hypothetical protein